MTLYEKEKELGRMLYVQSLAPYRSDLDLLRKYLVTQIGKLGVNVRCGQEATVPTIEREKPDVVVVATGARPALPPIKGIETHRHVVFAEDVLLERVDVGNKVLVIDADIDHDYAALGSYAAQFVAKMACVREDVAMHILRWSPQHSPDDVKEMAKTPIGRQVTVVSSQDRIADVFYHHFHDD